MLDIVGWTRVGGDTPDMAWEVKREWPSLET